VPSKLEAGRATPAQWLSLGDLSAWLEPHTQLPAEWRVPGPVSGLRRFRTTLGHV
jgi:hypothetical protein